MTTLSFESANVGDSGNGQLLHDIEEISKALYLPKASQRPLISSFNAGPESTYNLPLVSFSKSKLDSGFSDDEGKSNREKKSSAWSWKPLKALSHLRQRKFNCCFFCHVHHIENLPSSFDGLDMSVHWKRKDDLVSTLISRVCSGVVEFEDTLMSRCSVYGTRTGQGSFVKYEPKHFLLYPSIVGTNGIDIGKHWVDLTRLLPIVFEELEEDKCTGKWTTSFKLGGSAKGATLHVSFGFLVINNGLLELGNNISLPLVFNLKQSGLGILDSAADSGPENGNGVLRRVASVPSSLDCGSSSSSQCSDIKVLHQVWPNPMELSGSVDILYRKLDEDIMAASRKFDSVFENSESFETLSNPYCDTELEASGNDCGDDDDNDAEFTVTERGVELDWPMDDQLKLEESAAEKSDTSSVEVIDVAEFFKDELRISDEDINLGQTLTGSCSREMEKYSDIEELDCDIWNLFISESLESESKLFEGVSSSSGPSKMVKSLSLDSMTKAVSDDFLRLLGEKDGSYNSSQSSDHGSPRERLLREFEKDAMGSGSFLNHSDAQQEDTDFSYLDLAISTSPNSAMADLIANQSKTSKTKPKLLESLETQSLMQRWGFDEDAFQNSSDSSTGGFGSPIYLPPDEPAKLPPLGEGLGSILQLNDGGFLRSMSPSLFMSSKNGGNLIIQVSRPAVLPAAMGSELLEVLQCMASGGLELLTKQAHDMMPLDDLSGKIIQTLACSEEMCGRNELNVKLESWGSSSTSTGNGSGFQDLSIKELVPLVMDSIESLSVEGLRIQSGMSNLVAPSSIILKSDNDQSAFGKNELQISTVNRTGENSNSLMDLSLPLDEWLRLDSGLFRDKDHKSETTSRLMEAHHAKSSCYNSMENSIEDDNIGENASMKCGLLEDDLVIALQVQLRDPLRDFESVGPPMIALIQVRREFGDSGLESFGGDCVSRFVLEQVHVAGFVTESGKEEIWANKRQQQSGCRWLVANNMDNRHKTSRSQLSKSNAITTRVVRRQQSGNILWSISSKPRDSAHQLNELTVEDSYLRNPDVVFS